MKKVVEIIRNKAEHPLQLAICFVRKVAWAVASGSLFDAAVASCFCAAAVRIGAYAYRYYRAKDAANACPSLRGSCGTFVHADALIYFIGETGCIM